MLWLWWICPLCPGQPPTRFIHQQHHTTTEDLVQGINTSRTGGTDHTPIKALSLEQITVLPLFAPWQCCNFRRHTPHSSSSQHSSPHLLSTDGSSHYDNNRHSHTPSHTHHFSHRCHSHHSMDQSHSHSSSSCHAAQHAYPCLNTNRCSEKTIYFHQKEPHWNNMSILLVGTYPHILNHHSILVQG